MKPHPGSTPRTCTLALFLLSSLPWIMPAAGLVATPASAQRGPVQRIVQGKVTDKGDAPLRGAVVYLKDDHTLSVKSFISDDTGGYRFGQLAQSTDYEVWAEADGKKSSIKSISSFDSKNDIVINLKIDTGK